MLVYSKPGKSELYLLKKSAKSKNILNVLGFFYQAHSQKSYFAMPQSLLGGNYMWKFNLYATLPASVNHNTSFVVNGAI